MGKIIGGWVLVLFSAFTMLCGLLLFVAGVFESEKRVHNLITGLVIMFVSFRLLRLGWQMGAPNRPSATVDPPPR